MSDPQPGTVVGFAGSAAPTGWLICDGTSYATATYPNLFAAVGYTYGGSGANFQVPDLRGRVVMGVSGSHALASTGGEETHTLVTGEMPAHDHGNTGIQSANHTHTQTIAHGTSGGYGLVDSGTASSSGFVPPTAGESADHTHATSSAGGGGAHNNLQPYLALNHIIKT